MPSPASDLFIDARPRGPAGPLARESILGQPVLVQLVELVAGLPLRRVTIHAREDEQDSLRLLLGERPGLNCEFRPGPPPVGSLILRTDRLYDRARLLRVLRRGKDPESAVIWRLDSPSALAGANDELLRRRTYQPLGRFWALAPARWLARVLRATPVRPNALTLTSAALVLGAAWLIGSDATGLGTRMAAAVALALALIFDTADGHLARLQGTASEFGRWLDSTLDELGDMVLHAAIAWACFARTQVALWLVVGMLYGMGKYLFYFADSTWTNRDARPEATPGGTTESPTGLRLLMHWFGHADVRLHAWIVLALLGHLDLELIAFTAYYPLRALAGAMRKAGRHA